MKGLIEREKSLLTSEVNIMNLPIYLITAYIQKGIIILLDTQKVDENDLYPWV